MWMWSTGINRNIVECKDVIKRIICACFFVLIETLWNVKRKRSMTELLFSMVLIETLWNVKFFRVPVGLPLPGINRNIVECKGDGITD